MQHNGNFTQSYAFQSNKLLLLNDNDIQFFQHNGTSYDVTLQAATPSADRTVTIPNATGTLSITTATETLTNKTLTNPIIYQSELNTSISGSAFLDEDDMASNSNIKVASQQSIKAYVDTQVATVPVGDITAVTAGTGLSGGGTSGNVTLNLDVTTLGIVEASKAVTADVSGNVRFPDQDKLRFGTSDDLEITHDSNNNIIRDNNAKALFIQSDNTTYGVSITKKFGTETMARFIPDGPVYLHHDSLTKFFYYSYWCTSNWFTYW